MNEEKTIKVEEEEIILSYRSDALRFPVLMTIHRKFCSFFHPMYNTTIRRVIPELVDATLFHAKGAWLLLARRMERGDNDSTVIFFFNVNTMVKIDVPLSIHPNGFTFVFNKMCFFSNPDSTDWSIIGTDDGYEIGTIKYGQPLWTIRKFRPYNTEISTNPVVAVNKREKLCYSLGSDGTLFSFDPTKLTEEGVTVLHKVSKKPPPLPLQTIQNNRYYFQIIECFLVPDNGNEEDGVLLAIFKHKIDIDKDNIYEETYITSVYEFNVGNREWRKLDNLGNRMLFVARTGSMLFQVGKEASSTMMMAKNKVYYPNVQMGNIDFFSLTESDHCSLLNPEPSHSYGRGSVVTKQKIDNNYLTSYSPTNCGWIDPCLNLF